MDKNGASTGFYQPKPPCPNRGKGTPAANLPPPFKSWAGLARLREETSLGQRRDPGSENRAGLPGRCRPALARTGRSNSSECQAVAARHGEPLSPGGRGSGGAPPLCLYAQGVLWGWAGDQGARLRPAAVETAHLSLPVAEIRSDGARVRRRRAERSVGSGVRDSKLS